MFWPTSVQAVALFASTGLSIWAAVIARTRRGVPGGTAFSWLMLAVAWWSFTSAMHTLIFEYDTRLVISKFQYLGVASIGVLWLLFTTQYSRIEWPAPQVAHVLVWIVPIVTLLMVATNEQHHLHWAAIDEVMTPIGRRLVYRAGPWYWVHASYSYFLVLIGTATLVAGLRRFPPPYRRQTALIILGAIVPWIGNLLYLSRALPVTGLDLTPIAFTVSGACFTFGIYRYRLFGLVPVARDMVVDSMDDGVLVLDAQRRIVDLNAAAERYTGCNHSSFGRPIDEVVAWWTEAVDEEHPLAEGQPALVKVEPGPRYFEVKVSAVRDSQRRFAGWLVIVHDVSNRRRNEAERYKFERRLQEQQKSESLMVLAGGVAHDFNNLLTGILGNADLLAMLAPQESDQRRAAEAIVIGAQRAADLVSKMLAYSGGGRVVAQHVDLDALVKEMVDLLGASVARHCTLTYNSPGPLPLVETDPTQIRQVVLNLIVNAAEAVDDHGVITVETGVETLDRATLKNMTFGEDVLTGKYVFIDVVDNGCGMNEHTLARMFDPFYSTKDQGRGLGMAAVRGIVRSHRAALRVTSAVGQGTRFRVWFPLGLSIHSTSDASEVTRGQSTPS
ncbi:MAG TPA: histidine kinase N-terminal 7TM domain-containing protein [Vicinamibacterales bacterium]|nr:histidine kinase N-terminal 7TM domain-containing protein [Vicinamibacterales bacterium]